MAKPVGPWEKHRGQVERNDPDVTDAELLEDKPGPEEEAAGDHAAHGWGLPEGEGSEGGCVSRHQVFRKGFGGGQLV